MNQINTSLIPGAIPVTVGSQVDGDSIECQFPATEAQLEVWLSSQQSVEANCAYNQISSLNIRSELDPRRLQQAIDKVVERNSLLRARFSADGQQVFVNRATDYFFKSSDLSGLTESQRNRSLSELVKTEGQTPFDLVNGPLLRVNLQKLSAQDHVVTFTAHHLVLDGWSLTIFCRDLGYFYDTLSGIERDPLPPVNRFNEFAAKMSEYLESDAGRLDEDFWVNQFAGQIPVLDLPVEFGRPPLRTYTGARTDFTVPAELVENARKVGAKVRCSLFNVMLASFSAFVARISGQEDFCIGIPTAGQAAMDQTQLVGHCVNTMPYRTKVDVNQSFVDNLKAIQSSLLDSFEHQRYSYGMLLRKLAPPRDPSRPPMLSIFFNIDPVIDVSEMGFEGMVAEVQIEPRCFEHFEWYVNGVIHKDKSIEMQVQYNADLYSLETMQMYLEGFAAFLECLTTEPDAAIKTHHLMSIQQRQRVIVDWNHSALEYPVDATLQSEFSRQATETPEKIAVKFSDSELTYADVEARSNQIARYLKAQDVKTGDLVGICVDRSAEMLVYLYAIMKSGAGYVPLDPAYPSERLQYMCDHSGLKLIVTEKNLSNRVAKFNKPLLVVDSSGTEIGRFDSNPVENSAGPGDICYVIYTSGSTGKPKGVQVPHGAVVNFLYSMKETPGFAAGDSLLAVTTLSFDIAVLELYLPTITGGTVVVLDSMTSADGVKLGEQLVTHDISVMQATPATWRLMVQAGWKGKEHLKVLCGGEPMPKDLVQPLLDRCGELWNMYGPTETTVWSAAFQITSADGPILIGKPIGNTQIYILDQNGNEVPVGCEGEVFIGGAGVTLGYRNRQDLTDERFVENRYRDPFVDYVSDRLYKTGDLARYRLDGNIQFLRRNDKQVKVRGFRIELGEIESALDSNPRLVQNVVIVCEDTAGDARLVAYFVAKQRTRVEASELRDQLRQTLPYYMVPQNFVQLDAFPKTNNGKIDYKALPVPTGETTDPGTVVSPQTPAEKYLATVWQEALETDDFDLNDTFFDIGGHSLLVMKVITAVFEKTGVKLGPQDFLVGTLEQLAAQIAQAYAFEESATTSTSGEDSDLGQETEEVPAEPKIKPNPAARTVTRFGGVFKRLTGFWD